MSQAVHGGRIREAQERYWRQDFIDFSVNTNAFWHPDTTLDAFVLSNAITLYPEADAGSVQTLLANLYGVCRDRVLATAGAIEGLYLAARLFAGKRALLFVPCFADYARACEAAGIEYEKHLMLPHVPRFEELVDLIKNYDLVVLGNPNNPTGRLFPSLTSLVSHPALAHVHWIIDEAFIEFSAEPERISLLPRLEAYPNVIVLRALTKSWAVPGLRIGFLATANVLWMTKLRAMQSPWALGGVAEVWAFAHLNHRTLAAVRESLVPLPQVRERLSSDLAALPGLSPLASDANFLLVETSLFDADKLADQLGRQGIIIRVCSGFDGVDQRRYFRVAVRTPEENGQLVLALKRAFDTPTSPQFFQVGEMPKMRAISVLGTSSNSGKSWVATALCAWLRRRGVRVAPFKAQNMSNNSAVAFDGGEIGRAQAVQAEACRLAPSIRMNPILLKPSGKSGSQLVVLGEARGHLKASEYYQSIESLWPVVSQSLDYWRDQCDVLVLEGAGSPVELNLMRRDLVNLRPVRYLQGKWLLVADIERGGVFAQTAGTWSLIPPPDRGRCAGVIVNKFRGDLALFADAGQYFAQHFGAPYLGTLPYANHLQPESEDTLAEDPSTNGVGTPMHWIRFPHISNSQDSHPWQLDEGVNVEWVSTAAPLAAARVVVLPGSKNTLADLEWLRASGIADAVIAAHRRGAVIVGICGGLQMLGERLSDPSGLAGDGGEAVGLGLLPVRTVFSASKVVRNVVASFEGEQWDAYEIHMGRTVAIKSASPWLEVSDVDGARCEGFRHDGVWGTYVHGVFESARVRTALVTRAGITSHRASLIAFRAQRETLYDGMADLLEAHLNLEDLWHYVAG